MGIGGNAPEDFLASLSHELRNPLAPMRSAAYALALIGGDAEMRRIQAILERQLTHMSRLLDDLLDLCRSSYGMMPLADEAVEAASLAERAVTLTPLIDHRGLKLEFERPAESVWLAGDSTRLAQALGAFLDHAATRSPERGTVRLGYELRDGEVVFRVRDYGPPITAEALPHLFDLFSKIAYSASRRAAGCGLGLPLARRLVDLHGGRVEAHAMDEGIEIAVSLPASQKPKPGQAASPEGEQKPRTPAGAAKRRVLIVDDNVDAAESLALVFGLSGHAVETVNDGPSAIAAARIHHPDTVVLDIGLPGMDGYEVARQLRRLPGMEEALLIAVTGFDQDCDREKSRAAGIDCHLVKPADPVKLQALLADPPPRNAAV